MEIKASTQRHFNLVGIVPTAGQKLDFSFPWHDSLQPIGRDYLAVEKAVLNCAIAGCRTIWIACPKDMQPLIRYRLGDYIIDPYELNITTAFARYPAYKEIPIYYVPIHPKDVDRRDSLSWSIITGAYAAYRAGKKISKWVTPDRYFVSFPYGMFPDRDLQDCRPLARSHDPFYVSYQGETFKDGLYLPFTFTPEDFLVARKKVRTNETRSVDAQRNKVPLENRWTGTAFLHDFVFQEVNDTNANTVAASWYYDIGSWKGLKKWLGSDYSLDKPAEVILSYHEWNPIGVDNEKK
jgi:hypothetical protein